MTHTQQSRLTPVSLHETLDYGGMLDDAEGPGCYALELRVPDSVEAVHRQWLTVHEHVPQHDGLDQLAEAGRVAYVGASKHVRRRLEDHVNSELRQAAFVEAFDPVDVVKIWPFDSAGEAFEREGAKATELAHEGWVVAKDGEVR